MIGTNQFAAAFHGLAVDDIVKTEDASAHAFARFQDGHVRSGGFELIRAGESRKTAADNDDLAAATDVSRGVRDGGRVSTEQETSGRGEGGLEEFAAVERGRLRTVTSCKSCVERTSHGWRRVRSK